MSTPFAETTAVRAVGAGRYEGSIDPEWNLFPLPQGGVVTAVALRAMAEELGDPGQVALTLLTAFAALTIEKPLLWWPYQMGGQPLYQLAATVTDGGLAAGAPPGIFGIRTVTSTLTGPSALAPEGVRRIAINGVPFLVRGGGFAENLFLYYSASDVADQIILIKSLGLNLVRTEGKEMPADFYDQMDRAGIMIDAGFHPMTMYFPLVVHGAMLIEPTETESRREIDRFCDALLELAAAVQAGDVERFKGAPFHAPLRRLDETQAARKPRLRWTPPEA